MQVRTTGCNAHGQLGLGDTNNRVLFTAVPGLRNLVAVQAGDEHSAAVTLSGHLYLWGRGDSGQLGVGDLESKLIPTRLETFQVVHPGESWPMHHTHTC